MNYKCNHCEQPITPPRLFAPEQTFKCKTCGAKYEQVVIRQITEKTQ